MLGQVSTRGVGTKGARQYEKLLRDEIVKHLRNLDVKPAENAWTTHLSPERAEEASNAALDRSLNAGGQSGYYARKHFRDHTVFTEIGSTVAVKDNIVTNDLSTSCASHILRDYVAPKKATIVERLENAGLTILGKTNMDEFGMGSHSRHSAFGPMQNVGESQLSVGGSSGGSALLVALGLAHYAIGTDTGGSVRLPAAYLNIVGFKPSYGLISRYGVVPYANSLDTVGLFAKSVADLFPLFTILNHPDGKDPTCLDQKSRIRNARLHWQDPGRTQFPQSRQRLKRAGSPWGKRIGVPVEYNIAEMQNGMREAWMRALNLLLAQGHDVVPVSLPSTQQALSAYYVLAPAEASSNLAKYDGVRYGIPRDAADVAEEAVLYSSHRGKQFGEEVRRRILLGAYSLSAGAMDNFFIQAQKVRRLVLNDFNRVLKWQHPLLSDHRAVPDGVDYIVCPTAPTFPPNVNSLSEASPLEAYTNDVFTVPASLAGLPAISVPAPQSANSLSPQPERAAGIQIIGQYGHDYELLKFAMFNFENTQDWSRLHQEHRKTIY